MRATVLRLFAAGLGAFVLAGSSLVTFDSLHVNHAPAFVFAAVAPGCQVLDDANSKLLNTPWHSYTTTIQGSSGDPPVVLESIFVDGVTYTNADGTWFAMPIPTQPMKDNTEANDGKKDLNRICKHVRDESVNGDKAAVYSVRSTINHHSIYLLMWISNSRGLILRIDYYPVIKRGDKSHASIRYDYCNVQKPQSIGYDFNNPQKPQF